MEGVLVSAKRSGSTVTITVASDSKGRYLFPRNKLEPGQYSVRIRAAGYDLNDPGPVEITAQKTAQLDLKPGRTQDLSSQLSNAEWLLSAPGTEEQKKALLECVSCHTLERIFRSHYNAAEFMKVVQRMGTYAQGSNPQHPQLLRGQREARERLSASQTEYVSTINLSSVSKWEYPLKTLPRPKGKATRVIVTEYDLPRPDAMPHDAVLDPEGMVWYSDFGQQYLGRLDPKTAKVVEYSVPETKPGFPTGSLDVGFDPDGNVWVGMMYQGSVVKFDRKTQKFQTWGIPKDLTRDIDQIGMVLPQSLNVDGKVWLRDAGRIQRLDVRSGEWEPINVFRDIPKNSPAGSRPHSVYGIAADSQNNLYVMDFGSEYIEKMDAKTGKLTLYPTPTFNSAPRRGHVDSQGRLWFAEYRGNKIGMFNTKTEQFQEWAIPTPFSAPYDVVLDKNGQAWTGGMATDHIVRLNTKTGEVVEYLLPRSTNIRRVDVDNSTNPATLWVGNNHGASLIKLEPLE